MPYEVQTPVFEGPFDLLLHLILREQVDLYEVCLSTIVDAYLAELERMEELDLEMATEFLLIAATLVELKSRRLLPRRRRRRPRRRAGAVGGARPAPRPPARVQDVQGRRHRPVGAWRATPAAASAAPSGVDERFLDLMPDLLAGVTLDDLRLAYLRAIAPKPVPARRPRPRGADPGLGHRRRRRAGRRAAPGRPHHVPGAHRRPGRAARGRRAVPRRARAVQAGPGRPRPAPHLRRHRDRVAGRRRTTVRRPLADVDAYDG